MGTRPKRSKKHHAIKDCRMCERDDCCNEMDVKRFVTVWFRPGDLPDSMICDIESGICRFPKDDPSIRVIGEFNGHPYNWYQSKNLSGFTIWGVSGISGKVDNIFLVKTFNKWLNETFICGRFYQSSYARRTCQNSDIPLAEYIPQNSSNARAYMRTLNKINQHQNAFYKELYNGVII